MSVPKVGDRYRYHTTGVVTEIVKRRPGWNNGSTVVRLDNGAAIEIDSIHPRLIGTRLKHPRPEVGAIITGRRMRDTWWKAGTIFQSVDAPEWVFVLCKDGTLAVPGVAGRPYTFRNFLDHFSARVVYLP